MMGMKYLAISAVSTLISFAGLQLWTVFSLDKVQLDGIFGENSAQKEGDGHLIEMLFDSHATVGLLANFVVNVFILIVLCLKTLFFTELYTSESRKLVERLVNYVIYKGTFLPLVIPPTIYQAALWSLWLTVLCCLKMFQALARDRLERLNASPSSTSWTYFRVYSALLMVLIVDILWIKLCMTIYKTLRMSLFLLLFFEPLSVGFETLQAILVHGFQFLDIWLHNSAGESTILNSKFFDLSAAGSLWEWKGTLIRNFGFLLDMATLMMALGHYVQIWRLHGMAFNLMDAVLLLNIRALVSAIIKRIKGFIKLRKALGTLHAALPDATFEEIQSYDDECAICREPMAKAKKLKCNHLFHLACLRSWLDQGLNEFYSCPTCRKPLFVDRQENEANPRTGEIFNDEPLARQLSARPERQDNAAHAMPAGVFPSQTQAPIEGSTWRKDAAVAIFQWLNALKNEGSQVISASLTSKKKSPELDPNWLQNWPAEGVDGAGPSSASRPVGMGRFQMMMRQIASVGETYAHSNFEDSPWSFWPMHPSQAASSAPQIPPTAAARRVPAMAGLHIRTASRADDNLANMLAMAETVREVLPHIPDELIFQDLQRTNSVTVTVNNLLQM